MTLTPFTKKMRDLFAIDTRALAVFRISMSLLLLWDLLTRCVDLTFFYSDYGVLPRALLLSQIPQPWVVSVHLMSGLPIVQLALILIHIACALCLLIGYRTRAATIACWFLLASLQRRNHMVLGGGDDYFRMMFFWAMFVPLGTLWSVDNRLEPSAAKTPRFAFSWGTASLLVQTLIVYWTTVARRAHVMTWHNGTAVFDTLSIFYFGRWPGRQLLLYPGLLSLLTHSVIAMEILGPLLLFFPFRTARVRFAAALGFMAMHLGFYSFMYLEIFPRISIIALIVFLPAFFWDRISLPVRSRFLARVWDHVVDRLRTQDSPLFSFIPMAVVRGWEACAGVFLLCIMATVLSVFIPVLQPLAQTLGPLTTLLHLDQPWAMFGNPAIPNGWIVVRGITRDGNEVDAAHPKTPLTWARPADPLATFRTEREREYAMNFVLGVNTGMWPGYADYVCRQWNAKAGSSLRSLDVVMMTQRQSAFDGVRRYERVTLMHSECSLPYQNSKINYQWRNAYNDSLMAPAMFRPQQVAGMFYPAEPNALASMVDHFLEQAPVSQPEGDVVAILVPHAGYGFSGAVAAAAYKALSKQWDTVILLGPAHKMALPGAAIWGDGAFQTPLAAVPVNAALAHKIATIGDPIQLWTTPHQGEHSLEVQLPFLQRRLKNFSIVPILTNSDDPVFCRHLGESIAHIMRGKRTLLLISTDLSHYPSADLASRMDATTMAAIKAMDPTLLHATSQLLMGRREENVVTPFCGGGALMTGLYAAKALGATKATLVKHGYAERAPGVIPFQGGVSYASFVFTKSSAAPTPDALHLDRATQAIVGQAAFQSIAEAVRRVPFRYLPLQNLGVLNLPAAVFARIYTPGSMTGLFAGSFHPDRTLLDQTRYWARTALFNGNGKILISPEQLPDVQIRLFITSSLTPVHGGDIPATGGVLIVNGSHQGFAFSEDRPEFPTNNAFLAHVCQIADLPPTCGTYPGSTVWSFKDQWFDYSR